MGAEKRSRKSSIQKSYGTNNVEDFLSGLEHPRKQEILALRKIILGVDPSIEEDIKWNVPSFLTKEFFASFHLQGNDSIQIILHFGAKKRVDSIQKGMILDSDSLLVWLGKDRASVKFVDIKDILAKKSAFEEILRQWIRFV